MKTLFLGLLVVFGTTSRLSAQTSKDALEHLISYDSALQLYLNGLEYVLKQSSADRRMRVTGGLKNRPDDSLYLVSLFDEFNQLRERTLIDIHRIKKFPQFDLLEPTIKFVDETSHAVSVSYYQIVFVPSDIVQTRTKEQWNERVHSFMNELSDAMKKYRTTNQTFMETYNVMLPAKLRN